MNTRKVISIVAPTVVVILAAIILVNSVGNLQEIDQRQKILDDRMNALQIINNTMNDGTISPSQTDTLLAKLEHSGASSSSITSEIQTIKPQKSTHGYEKPTEELTATEKAIKDARNETVRECVPVAYKWNAIEDERKKGTQYSDEGNITVSETQEQLNACDSDIKQIDQSCDSDGLQQTQDMKMWN